MGKYDAGIDAINAIAEKFRGILELADALKAVDSIENAAEENTVALQRVTATLVDLKAKVEAENTKLNDIKKATAEALDKVKKQSEALVEEALANADKTRAKAAQDAIDVIAAAQAEAKRLETVSQNALAANAAQLANIRNDVAAAKVERDAALAELRAVEGQINAMNKAAANVLARGRNQ